jgi:hypothetical protein
MKIKGRSHQKVAVPFFIAKVHNQQAKSLWQKNKI